MKIISEGFEGGNLGLAGPLGDYVITTNPNLVYDEGYEEIVIGNYCCGLQVDSGIILPFTIISPVQLLFKFRFQLLYPPSSSITDFITFVSNRGSSLCRVQILSTGYLYFEVPQWSSAVSTSSILFQQWNDLVIFIVESTSAYDPTGGEIIMYLNGVEVMNSSPKITISTPSQEAFSGIRIWTEGMQVDDYMFLDDLSMSSTADFANEVNSGIFAYSPSSDTESTWQVEPVGTPHYEVMARKGLPGDIDTQAWIYTDEDANDQYTISPDSTVNVYMVNSVEPVIRAKKMGGMNNLGTSLNLVINGATFSSTVYIPKLVYGGVYYVSEINPYSGIPWYIEDLEHTEIEINSLNSIREGHISTSQVLLDAEVLTNDLRTSQVLLDAEVITHKIRTSQVLLDAEVYNQSVEIIQAYVNAEVTSSDHAYDISLIELDVEVIF